MGFLNSFTNSLFPNPADSAQGPINSIPGTITPYYKPYTDAGANALPGYQDTLKQLMSDPQKFLSMIGQGYQKSPGYDWKLNQAEQGATNANAAGGMLGTPQHQQQAAQIGNDVASQDYNDYMNRVLSTLGMGLQGTGGLVQQGAQSSGDLATSLANALMTKSGLQYAGQADQNKETGGLLNSLISLFGGGGGGSSGGFGSAIGSGLSSAFAA